MARNRLVFVIVSSIVLALASVTTATTAPFQVEWLPDRYEVALHTRVWREDPDQHVIAETEDSDGASPAQPGVQYRAYSEIGSDRASVSAYMREDWRPQFEGLAGVGGSWPEYVSGATARLDVRSAFIARESGWFELSYALRAWGSQGDTEFLTELAGPGGRVDAFEFTTISWEEWDENDGERNDGRVYLDGWLEADQIYDLHFQVDLDAWDWNWNDFSIYDFQSSAHPVPEPGSVGLMAFGLLAVVTTMRMRGASRGCRNGVHNRKR